MASPGVAQGLSSFVQAFSAVDAVGSRRRREKLLDERLEDERLFRSQQVEFAQSREDRAQELHEESQEERQLRIEADGIGLDPESTDAQLREAGKRSLVAREAINHRKGLSAFKGLADATIASRQVAAIQAGQQEEPTQETASLSSGVQVAELPKATTTREVRRDEIVAQSGFRIDPVAAGVGNVSRWVEVPGDFKTLDELDALPDQKEAQAIRVRQKAELLEADPRSGTARAEIIKDVSKRKATNDKWAAATKVSDLGGDSMRQQLQENPSAAVAEYARDRNNLSAATRTAADKIVGPAVKASLAENNLVLQDPELDPTSRDAANANRKVSVALGVAQEILLAARPGRDAGIRQPGIPQGNKELAAAFGVAMLAAAKGETTLSAAKSRQGATQLQRNTANPTKRVGDHQLNNLYWLAQSGQIPVASAIYAASHGGALPPDTPSIIQIDPKKDAYVTYPGGIQLLRGASNPDDEANRNLLAGASGQILTATFSRFNTKDYPDRGDATMGAFLAGLRTTEDEANAAGIDFSNPLDVNQVAQAWIQEVALFKELESQWWEAGDFNPKYEDHVAPDIWTSIYKGLGRKFLAGKEEEGFLNEFAGMEVGEVGGRGVNVAGARQAAERSNDPQLVSLFDSMTNEQLQAWLIQNSQSEQGLR